MRWTSPALISNTGAYDKASSTGGIANAMYQKGVGVGSTGGLQYGRPLYGSDIRATTMPGDTGDVTPVAGSAAAGRPTATVAAPPSTTVAASKPAITPGFTAPTSMQLPASVGTQAPAIAATMANTGTPVSATPTGGWAGYPTPQAPNPQGTQSYDPWGASGQLSPAQQAQAAGQNPMYTAIGYADGGRTLTPAEQQQWNYYAPKR